MVDKISKEQISELPLEVFDGSIVVVDTEAAALQTIALLENESLLGFDSETKPSFKKGKRYQIALIQIATEEKCYLFRLNKIGFPDCLIQLLQNPSIRKIGLSLKDDFAAIRRRVPDFKPQNFIELQTVAKQAGLQEAGLQRIYGILYGKKISKSQRLSNWESEDLSPAQQMYGAIDAWACLRIYKKLFKLVDIKN